MGCLTSIFGILLLPIFYLIARSNPGNQNINKFSIQGVFKLLIEIVGPILMIYSLYELIKLFSCLVPANKSVFCEYKEAPAVGFTMIIIFIAFWVSLLITIITFKLKIGQKDSPVKPEGLNDGNINEKQ